MSLTIPIGLLVAGCLFIALITVVVFVLIALLLEGEREADRRQEEIFRLRRKWAHASGKVRPPDEVDLERHTVEALAVANSVRWVEPTGDQLASWAQLTGYDWSQS